MSLNLDHASIMVTWPKQCVLDHITHYICWFQKVEISLNIQLSASLNKVSDLPR